MYCTTIDWGTPAYDDTIRLREEVLRKPLGLTFLAEEMAQEFSDIHLACYDVYDHLLACLVLVDLDGKQLKIKQVAVDPTFQRKGVGSLLVEVSEDLARSLGFTKMVLNARDIAVPFYKGLKYSKIGKPFTEVSIKHYKMIKKL